MRRIPPNEDPRRDDHWSCFKQIEVPLVSEKIAEDPHCELDQAVNASQLGKSTSVQGFNFFDAMLTSMKILLINTDFRPL